ncbi:MAG: acetyl-CoA carboxylase biotin carboxyl carrier protein [Burkholderiales bacterium]|nr:acetyl-CoA carboxylase biotin carboxyl carrier protein [Burkholderiales bacterium]OJX07304.1 MAG: acetyl-CoA carboxylase, biotin carboxyl carrier protein [Burkholderiales bacterium 70-64]
MSISHEDVERIIRLLEASHFDELHLELDGLKLDLRRRGAGSAETVVAKQLALPAPSAPAPTGDLTVSPVPAAAASGLVEIKAPMLGTFYRAPKPGADPFVAIGSRIEPDTVIGIIEVMKLMNSVAAGVSGEVVEIVAPDAHLVEYDQVLVRVHPAVERR